MSFTINLHHTFDPSPPDPRMDQVLALLKQLIGMDTKAMAALDDEITTLTADVAANTSATASANTMINGFAAQLAAAVAAAQGAGATPAQLQSFTDLGTAIQANSAALSAAVAQNTPAAAGQ